MEQTTLVILISLLSVIFGALALGLGVVILMGVRYLKELVKSTDELRASIETSTEGLKSNIETKTKEIVTSINEAANPIVGAARDVEGSVEDFKKNLEPLLKDDKLLEALGTFKALIEVGREMGVRMDKINQSIGLFYRFAVQQPAKPAEPGSEESGVYGSTETEAAETEMREELRKQGVETEPGRVPEPGSPPRTAE